MIVEIHPNPEDAVSDGPQSLPLPMFEEMMGDVRRVAEARPGGGSRSARDAWTDCARPRAW